MEVEHWTNPSTKCFGAVLDGRAQQSGILQRGHDETLLLIFNAHYEPVMFHLPEVAGGLQWQRLIDTHFWPREQEAPMRFSFDHPYELVARSLVLLELIRHDSYSTARSYKGDSTFNLGHRIKGSTLKKIDIKKRQEY